MVSSSGVFIHKCVFASQPLVSSSSGVLIRDTCCILAMEFGATDFVNPDKYTLPIQQVLIDMTDGGLDYTFECIGNVEAMVSCIF